MIARLIFIPTISDSIDQDWLDRVSVGQALIVISGLLTLWGLIAKFGPSIRRIGHLVDDLSGEPARPGVDARPGLMERQAISDERVKHVAEMSVDILGLIRAEILPTISQLTPNHGSHLADAIRRIDAKQTAQIAKEGG